MSSVKTLGSIVLAGALFATAACADSSKSMNPTAPSGVIAATVNDEMGDPTAVSGATGNSNSGRPTNPGNSGNPGNGRGPSTPAPPTNTSPTVPSVPTNPVTGKVELEGLITAIAGTSITVSGRAVVVPAGAVIRHGSRAVAFAALRVGDRVHVRANAQGSTLEATEVKVQSASGDDGDDDGDDDDDDDDDDEEDGGRVRVSILDATAAEGGTDQGAFRLTRVASATLSMASPLTVTFTLSGTATNGTDYTTLPLTATFPAGSATVDIVVAPVADALAEGAETVTLTLASAAPYAIGSPATGTVTIADAAPVVSVTAVDAEASEAGPDLGAFRFSRTGPVTSSLTVTYTVTGTAVNGSDYQAIPMAVTFLSGQATANVFVIPMADGVAEGVETVIVTLTDGASYDLGAPATATVNIAG
jgi:hypothetical protein